MNPVLGAALHLPQYLSRAALVKAREYSSKLPVFRLALYRRSATKIETRTIEIQKMIHEIQVLAYSDDTEIDLENYLCRKQHK